MCARKLKKSQIFFVFLSVFSGSVFASTGRAEEVPSTPALLEVDSIYLAARADFQEYARNVYTEIDDTSLSYQAFEQGLTGYWNLYQKNELKREDILTIVDFSKPSNEQRMFIIDLCKNQIIHKTIVAHGANSGKLYAREFSNEVNSHMSSLGFYVTTTTYSGKFDLALRIDGKEHSNSHANSRGVVIHAASYATYEFLKQNGGTLGRSYGCPALPFDNFEQVVEWIKGGTCFFIYYPSRSYQRHSKYLNGRDYLVDFVDPARYPALNDQASLQR
jgi:hypothetical protein